MGAAGLALLCLLPGCGEGAPCGGNAAAIFQAGYISYVEGGEDRHSPGSYSSSSAITVFGGGLSLVLERDEAASATRRSPDGRADRPSGSAAGTDH